MQKHFTYGKILNSITTFFLSLTILALGVPAVAQTFDAHPVTTVSAASFSATVAPDSLGTIFSADMADNLWTARLSAEGQFPLELGGLRVEIGGRAVPLIFASPNQINFWIPPSIPVGSAEVRVINKNKNTVRTGTVEVSAIAPALFTIECLNATAGAALNAVTYNLEPFTVRTSENPGTDKRTRLSIFGTGMRSAREKAVFLVDNTGRRYPLAIEYLGAAPLFFGLDQINVVLASEFDGIGVVTVVTVADGRESNAVTVNIADSVLQRNLSGGYNIITVAGSGADGLEGDGGPALQAQLMEPSAIAIDRQGNLYVADLAGNVIRKILTDGRMERFAGNGQPGFGGDGGPAVAAMLQSPSGLAVNYQGDVFVADRDNHRIRKISKQGIITTVAGTGVAGFQGDLQPATQAKLSSPWAVAVDIYQNVLIADTGNHRIRRISADGKIATIAGTGDAGYSGDGFSAIQAKFDTPTSVAADVTGVVYVADGKNYRIRRVQQDGTVRTVIGSGVKGNQDVACPALSAKLDYPLTLAIDPLGRVLVGDSNGSRIGRLDSDCTLRPIAGVGLPGFAGDGGSAQLAKLNQPKGMVAAPNGDVFVTDSVNHRIRRLTVLGIGNCSNVVTVLFSPSQGTSGQTVTGTVSIGCEAAVDTVVPISADYPFPGLPVSVTIPKGRTSVTFTVVLPEVETPITILISSEPEVVGHVRVYPRTASLDLHVSPDSVLGNYPVTGTIRLGSPAPSGGQVVQLTSNNPGVQFAPSIVVPEGVSVIQIGILTPPVSEPTDIRMSAMSGALASAAIFTVVPAAGPGQGTIQSLVIAPDSVIGGQGNTTGTVTLASAAGSTGVLVNLTDNSPAVSVPVSLVIPAGQTSATFPITTSFVGSTTLATVTATSANSATAGLTLNASSAGTGTISGLVIAPSTVVGGQANATGTVTLGSPAGAGGVLVNLLSNNAAASVPSSIVIPQGQSSGSFAVTTSVVGSTTNATITATSANTVNSGLTLTAPTAGQGTISGLGIAPSTVIGGQANATGTVTLGSPAGAGGVLVTLSSDNAAATVPASVVIAQGESSGTFTVTTSAVASTTPVTITATSANSLNAGLTLNASSAGSGTISGLGIAPSSVVGGQANATGTVSLGSPAGAGGVLVNLSSNSGAASVPGSIVIPQGQTSGTFTVTTSAVGSTTPITITATSANTVNAGLTLNAASPGSGTISGLGIAPSVVVGGQANATATVTLGSPAGVGGVLVNLSSNSPAASVPASIIIPQGQSAGVFTVTTSAVASTTPATITATSANTVNASLTINAPSAGLGTISGLGLLPSTVVGGQENATGTVTLGAAAGAGGVLVSLSSNNPAASVPANIVIPQGQTSGTFTVTTSVVGSTVSLAITAQSANSVGAGLTLNPSSAGLGTISGLGIAPSTVVGGQANATGTVTLGSAAGANGVLVNLSSDNGAASVPPSVLIPQGQTSGTFTVTTSVVGSTTPATITATSANVVTAGLTLNAPAPGAGTISGFGVSPSSVVGGQANATGTVSLGSPAGAGGVLVNLSSNNGAASVPGSIVIPQGQSSGNFTVTTSAVGSTTPVTITATSANSMNAGLTLNQATNVSSVSVNPVSVTGGSGSTGTVTLSSAAGPGGVSVSLSSNNGAASVPASVTVPQGQTSANFAITTSPVASNQTVAISATLGSSNSSTNLAVLAPCINGLTLNVSSLLGGGSAIGTVTLTGPAPAGGATIPLASADGAVQLPPSVFVPAGQTSATFNVTTSPVLLILHSTIQALFGPCGGITVQLDVLAPVLNALSIPNININNLLGSGTGTVSLSGAAPTDLLVHLGTSSLLGGLGLTMPSTVTIPAGQTSANFPVSVVGLLLTALNITVDATSTLGNVSTLLRILP
ncbi:MAG: hypothetical protein ABIR70_23495 [Bryobacteraceae bacterium]